MAPNMILLATAIAHFAVAAGHTLKASEFGDTAFRRLKPILQGQARIGWFQGSVFLAITGLINYRWATEGFKGDRIDKAIVSLMSTIFFGSSIWYVKIGDVATAAVLAPVGILQIIGILSS